MPNAFNFAISPFDCLSEAERRRVRASVDIDYVREGGVLLQAGEAPEHLFVLIKGVVAQWEGEELVARFGPDDSFDGRALVAGRASGRFVAAEEVLAYRLAKGTVMELIAANATFGALLFADLSKKLGALTARHTEHEMQSLTMARVDQAVVRPAHVVSGALDVVSVVRLFTERKVTSVLVALHGVAPSGSGEAAGARAIDAGGAGEGAGEGTAGGAAEGPKMSTVSAAGLGLFSTAGLQRAILCGRPLNALPVGELASRPLITVAASAPLYDAQALMIRHRVQRLVVVNPVGEVLGLLEQLDLLSFLSNHSYLITRQIIEATDLPGLAQAAAQIPKVIAMLHRSGTKVSLIARLVQELNAQLFQRTWQLVAPPDLVAHSCLFVMGSEGRGEQLLKTDQDNGLILADGFEPSEDPALACARFSQALADFGYPECPGGIMVSNPAWRRPVADFCSTARRWLLKPSPDSLMALAIFLDAHAVAGDEALLAQVRSAVFALVNDNDALLARFAATISAFDTSSGWWNRLLSLEEGPPTLDLKKAGTFPLVHGVRSLALAHHITAPSTAARLEALVAAEALPQALATDLLDSLHFFMGLKLKLGLAALEAQTASTAAQPPNAKAAGPEAPKGLALSSLSSLDRDLLKDTLAVVKRFKALLHQRFHLDAL